MLRETVYKAIDTERYYQDFKWGEVGKTHSFEEWFTYIEDYVNEAKHVLSRTGSAPNEFGYEKASDIMRKVGAMAVCAMEQHGVREREDLV